MSLAELAQRKPSVRQEKPKGQFLKHTKRQRSSIGKKEPERQLKGKQKNTQRVKGRDIIWEEGVVHKVTR